MQVVTGQPGSRVIAQTRSLEVRWILPGSLGTAAAGSSCWLRGDPEVREDLYLLDPHLRGVSVKLRAGTALEVKVHQGSPGLFEVAGHAAGRMEYWQKWSFPCDRTGRGDSGPPGWIPVRKRRRVRRFSLAGGEAGCTAELTEVRARGRDWWSLAFEATGPEGLLRVELEAAAARVFDRPPPGLATFGLRDSRSYAQWLRDTAWRPAS